MPDVLFCPFCREPFEGAVECPDHGLRLVTLEVLSDAEAKRSPDFDAKLAMHDLRFGRGIVLLGAAITWLSIGLPVVRDGFEDGAETTGFLLWSLRADYLSVVPGAALLAVFTVFMRSTRSELRRVRAALGVAIGLAMLSIGVAAHHVSRYADDAIAAGRAGSVSPAEGAYVAVLGLVILAYGVARLGAARR